MALTGASEAFDPVVNADTRVLVLGSLPGQTSLQARRYYAHPGNQFWRLLSPVVAVDLTPLAYEKRLAVLLAAGIGLWDVIASAERKGSLDAAIRNPQVRDLAAMIATLPALRAVAFNGGTALRQGLGLLGPTPEFPILPLPSSSAAHAVGIAAKQATWDEIARYLV